MNHDNNLNLRIQDQPIDIDSISVGEGVHIDLEDAIEHWSEEEQPTIKKDGKNKQNYDELTAIPIVYTTRLDEMPIFNRKHDSMTIEDITNRILKESKPKYKNEKPSEKHISKKSFRNLATKINNINKKESMNLLVENMSSQKVFERNQRLLKMCKPLKIILERLEVSYNEQGRLITTKWKSSINAKISHCIIFHDHSIDEINIYSVENNSVIASYTLKGGSDTNHIIAAHKKIGIRPQQFECCCWHKRENYISSLTVKTLRSTQKALMQKPHRCKHGQCTCCCRHEKNNSRTPANIVFIVDDNDIECNSVEYGYKNSWLDDLLSDKESNSFISKALNYTRKTRPLQEFTEDAATKHALKDMKTKYLCYYDSEDTNKADFYELQEQGHAVAHLQVSRGSETAKDYKIKLMKHRNIAHFGQKRICCWHDRERKIRELGSDKLSNLTFLKLPPTGEPLVCNCKPRKFKTPLKDFALTNNDTPLYANKVALPKAIQRPNPITQMEDNTVKQFKILPKLFPTLQTPISQNSGAKTLPRLAPKPTLGNFTSVQNDNAEKNITRAKNQSINQSQSNVCTTPIESCAVDSMITTVLDRFKDVRLTINEDGKVAAALNAPVNTLTTAELKVLANILSYAQKQVKVLGLTPGSSIDASDLRNAVTSTEVLPTAPVQTIPLDPVSATSQSLSEPAPKVALAPTKNINSMRVLAPIQSVPVYPVIKNIASQSLSQAPVIRPSQSKSTGQQNKAIPNILQQSVNLKKTNPVPDNNNPPKSLDTFVHLSKTSNLSLMESYNSYVQTIDSPTFSNDWSAIGPRITNVFSLKNTEADNSTILNAQSTTVDPEISKKEILKRKSVDSDSKPPSKIRVVDPAKLGITNKPIQPVHLLQPIASLPEPPKAIASNICINEGTVALAPFGHVNPGILNSLPKIGKIMSNVVMPRTTSTITTGQMHNNNVFVISPQLSANPNFHNIQLLAAPTQIITNVPNETASSSICVTAAPKPRLLNAAPAKAPKKMPDTTRNVMEPAPLIVTLPNGDSVYMV